MTDEDRLRRLLHDPRWSLSAWPDAPTRLRRVARRQRRTVVIAGAAAAVALTAAAAGPITLLGHAAQRSTAGLPPNAAPTSTQPSAITSHPAVTYKAGLPRIGSAGFPARIYPAATWRAASGTQLLCPDPTGLEAPGPATPAAALLVLRQLGSGLRSDLHVSDRAAWPLLATSWRSGSFRLVTRRAAASVRYAGPLRRGSGVPARLRRAIAMGCGPRVARSTWVIGYGSASRPHPMAALLFVTRRGHMLFYRAA